MLPIWLLLLASPGAAAGIPAFPGAEGFGSHTPGGRGGQVLFVTNLNDSGPGSLRAACEARGPRTVVFRVGGLIDLSKPISIKEPFITVAGQTAPGDGVCLKRCGITVDSHDVVIRFLRVRPGDIAGREVDGMSIGGDSRNVVVDHCSVSWGVDECLSPSGGIRDVTVQWSIIAEGLNHSAHHKGAHGYGSLVRAIGGVTLHHNLWAHNQGRNPRLGDNYGKPPFPVHDVRNNVMYDFGGPSVAGDEFGANYMGNWLKPGPRTSRKAAFAPTERAKLRFFLQGNVFEGGPTEGAEYFTRPVEILKRALEAPPVETSAAKAAFEDVLRRAGASAPLRDSIDRRIVAEVRSGGGSIIDSQWEVGGWPEYKSARPPVDRDRDGMPDAYEAAHGLNPNDAQDAMADKDGNGYTNLEDYLNSLTSVKF